MPDTLNSIPRTRGFCFNEESIMGQVKSYFFDSIELADYEPPLEEHEQAQGRKMFLLLCNGKPLALYDHRGTADYEMHICIQGDTHEGVENTYRIKTMGVVTHAFEEN